MYRKFVIPFVAIAVLSVSASLPPVAQAAEHLPSIFHQSAPSQAAVSTFSKATAVSLNVPVAQVNEEVTVPADATLDFARSMVKSQPAPSKPKPAETATPSSSSTSPSASAAPSSSDAPGKNDSQNDINPESSGLAPWQIIQLEAQKNYIATMSDVPFTANPPAQPKGEEIVKIAKEHLGVPYVWGGTSPVDGWDCSGYVQWVFKQAGIDLPRVGQWVSGKKIDPKDAQPGDIVIQNDGTHVGIYIGNGRMYSALNPSVGTIEHSTDIMKADYYRVV